jgi:hypothetical protein
VNADTDFHFVLAEIEGRLAGGRNRTARERNADRARGRIDAITQCLKVIEFAPFLGGRADNLLHD